MKSLTDRFSDRRDTWYRIPLVVSVSRSYFDRLTCNHMSHVMVLLIVGLQMIRLCVLCRRQSNFLCKLGSLVTNIAIELYLASVIANSHLPGWLTSLATSDINGQGKISPKGLNG